MPACWMRATARASLKNRCTESVLAETWAWRTLIATRVLMVVCSATKTSPMPPRPARAMISKCPIVSPITRLHSSASWRAAGPPRPLPEWRDTFGPLMRQLLRVGLAAAAVSSAPVAADPATPQLSPLHRQREDAQRLHEQQRDLEQSQPAVPPPAVNRAPAAPAGEVRHTTRNAGLVLLGVAGISGLVALPLSASDGVG